MNNQTNSILEAFILGVMKNNTEEVQEKITSKPLSEPLLVMMLAASSDEKINAHPHEGRPTWTPKGDMERFLLATRTAGWVIFGKKTWESIPQKTFWQTPRHVLVVDTRNNKVEHHSPNTVNVWLESGVAKSSHLEKEYPFDPEANIADLCVSILKKNKAQIAIIGGGASVYGMFNHLADGIIKTHCPYRFPNGKTHGIESYYFSSLLNTIKLPYGNGHAAYIDGYKNDKYFEEEEKE